MCDFLWNDHLKTHMRVHTAEWKVLSAISESVDLHVGIHMKVKPYCKACDNTFRLEVSATVTIIKQLCSAQDKLKKHMNMCKRNSYCQICVFLLNLLKTHMVMHTTKVLWVLWQLSNNYVAQVVTIKKNTHGTTLQERLSVKIVSWLTCGN